MADTQAEFNWYCGEIDKGRRRCDRAWAEYSEARQQLDRLERERADLFRKLLKEADQRAAITAGDRDG